MTTLRAGWSEELTADQAQFYALELQDLGFIEVTDAIRLLGREGSTRRPTAGQVRRRVVERQIGVLDWTEARRMLVEHVNRIRDERQMPFDWVCPYNVCNGSGWVEHSRRLASHCACYAERIEARRATASMHPLVGEFFRDYVSLTEVEDMADGGRRDHLTLEAQLRDRWREFVHRRINSEVARDLLPPGNVVAGELEAGADAE